MRKGLFFAVCAAIVVFFAFVYVRWHDASSPASVGALQIHLIDTDADPSDPTGEIEWHTGAAETHHKSAPLKWDLSQVGFYLSDGQKRGDQLRKELEDKGIPALNVNVLDYLLAHPHLIPEEWKDKKIFFLGTIYRRNDYLYVRCLYWGEGKWGWGRRWLGRDWSDDDFAVVRIS